MNFFMYILLFFFGQDRGVLKLVSHGRKVNNLGLPRGDVFSLIVNCGLLPLCNICYEVADKGLLCGFVERWYRDTNIFHLPPSIQFTTTKIFLNRVTFIQMTYLSTKIYRNLKILPPRRSSLSINTSDKSKKLFHRLIHL